jgi:MraZ protein
MAFRGNYEHSLDDRGRVAIPVRFRDAFGDGGVLAPSPDGCLELYPVEDFENTARELSTEGAQHQRGRRVRRALYALSYDVEIDRQGRILIPQAMRERAGLDGPVVLAGRGECLEIWGAERWLQEQATVESEHAAILEAQGPLG